MSEAFRIASTYALLKPHQEKFLRADIEKALMAAEKRGEERERERCAGIAERGHWEARCDGHHQRSASKAVWTGLSGPEIAAAIRGS